MQGKGVIPILHTPAIDLAFGSYDLTRVNHDDLISHKFHCSLSMETKKK
jgi:hypothetical protein